MTSGPLKITTNDTQEKLEEKMRGLELQAREKETEKIAAQAGIPYINLKGLAILPEALALIPEAQARSSGIVCFFYSGAQFRAGALAPLDPKTNEVLYQIEERTHARGTIYMLSRDSLDSALKKYAALPKITPPARGVEITEKELAAFPAEFRSFDELQSRLAGVSITDLVNLLTAAGLRTGASDIHLEAEEKEVAVRLRIDGVLQKAARIGKEHWSKIASRVKLLSGLKINVTDRPQDGRFTIHTQSGAIEVRVSAIPTAYGESIAMRLLQPAASKISLESLGLRGQAFELLNREIKRPNGMILTTGPTGSGKTTTLYAILQKLNRPEIKIITLEDPIEYKLAGIQQSQIDASKEYSFADGLRSILRQDPDIIMVGEIRDLETAEIAIQAALTGHLVLSTVHTNSASGAIPRFLALGAKPFLLAPALNAVMAQRLVRKIHEECKEETQLDEAAIKKVGEILSAIPEPAKAELFSRQSSALEQLKFYRGRGCEKCFNLGYKGRIGIYEVFTMSKEIEQVILSGKISEYAVQELAVKAGMVTMVQDGLLKALDGITTVEEVFRVAE